MWSEAVKQRTRKLEDEEGPSSIQSNPYLLTWIPMNNPEEKRMLSWCLLLPTPTCAGLADSKVVASSLRFANVLSTMSHATIIRYDNVLKHPLDQNSLKLKLKM
ncbi:hypothetical protein HPP92_018672 [Vanilla planifolia]|uniref:Uncharacterized protein n=1 Tax=Vanilla planifolia TaxID=51239 RepID=A0A835QAD4_VANPL|nr:hypothetical protein HPP92_019263 [Vanilla planifolia]KAG0469344.1 hypothetical protein HPP92_018672 [Vanilla planifolia]